MKYFSEATVINISRVRKKKLLIKPKKVFLSYKNAPKKHSLKWKY